MMGTNRFVLFCDRGMVFSFCALIFFLPISTALVEWFVGLPLVLFFFKRGVVLTEAFRSKTISFGNSNLFQRGVLFLKAFQPIPNPLNKPIAVFIFANFLSMIFSQYPSVSIPGFLGKVLQNTFVYFTFLECINTKKRVKVFLMCFMASAFLVGMSGLFQYMGGEDFLRGRGIDDSHRMRSCFRQANDLGAYLVVTIPVLFALSFGSLFVVSKDRAFKANNFLNHGKLTTFLVVILLIISLISLALTLSRGAWVAFSMGLLFLGLYNSRVFVVMVNIVIWFAVMGLSLLIKNREEFINPLFMFVHQSNRFVYWKGAWSIIQDYPLLGAGVNAYSLVRNRYSIEYGGYPHNCYFQMTAETGWIGLISFLLIVFRLFSYSFSQLKHLQDRGLYFLFLGVMSGLFGFLVNSFFDTHMYSVQLGTLMWVMMGLVMVIPRVDQS